MKIKDVWALTKQSIASWTEDYAPSMGAALSYYTLFSIAPLLIIVISVAGLFFGAEAVRGVIFAQLQALMGDQGAKAIQEMLTTASHPSTGGLAAAVSVVGLLIGATTVFNELQSDLDRIWRVPARIKSTGLWTLLRTRMLSFSIILGVAFLLTVSLVTSAAVATLGKWWGAWFGGWEILAQILDLAINFGLLTLVFAMIYKVIPRAHVSWRDVWTGAGVTSLLFTLGKFLIGLYLGKSDMASAYGAAGSLVLVMVWVYYSSQIFLFGAEFTWVYANMYGSRRSTGGNDGAPPEPAPDVPTRTDETDETNKKDRADRADRTNDRGATRAAAVGASSRQNGDGITPRATAGVPPRDDPGAPRLTIQRRASHEPEAPVTQSAPASTTPLAPRQSQPALLILRDPRVAVGLAVATAIIVGVLARPRAVGRFQHLTRRMPLLR